MAEESNAPSLTNDRWHDDLVATLSDCDVQRAPRHPILNYILAVVVMLATMGVAAFLRFVIEDILRVSGGDRTAAYIGYPLLILFVVLVLSRVRNLFLRRAWQSSARSAEDEIKRDSSRRPILYLRSFRLDQHVARPSWLELCLGTRPFANAEQNVTRELRKLGPVIAIGRPSEKLPALGAARFYVSNERWKEKVIAICKEAQLILWATGETEGLRWELTHLTDNVTPERLILWAHPSLIPGSQEKREAAWQKFQESLGNIFPKPLPGKLGNVRFFSFKSDWTPVPYSANSLGLWVPRHVSALRQAVKIPPKQHRWLWFAWDLGRVAIGLIATLGIVFAATPEIARTWDLGVLHAADFWAAALALGAGVAMLAAGIAGLRKRRMHAAITWALVPVVAVGYWMFTWAIASPFYWRWEEAKRWEQFTAKPSDFGDYTRVPKRFKRADAYPLILESLTAEAIENPYGNYSNVQHYLDEIESQPYGDSLKDVKDKLTELAVMTKSRSNVRDLPLEYFQLWTTALESTQELNDQEMYGRAANLLNEISIAFPDAPEAIVLVPRIEALVSRGYSTRVEDLKTLILKTPYIQYELRQEIESQLSEVSKLAAGNPTLEPLKAKLLELQTMTSVPNFAYEYSPEYFKLWAKYLEASNLTTNEKSLQVARLRGNLEQVNFDPEESQQIRIRLEALAATP